MRILVIFTGAYPEGEVTTHRVHNICKGLVENGADVELLLVRPTEKTNSVRNPSPKGVFEGVKYQYCRNMNIRSSSFLKRRWDDFLCSFLAIIHVLLNKSNSDVTVIIGPSFDCRILLPIAAKFSKTKIILEINEYPFVLRPNNLWTRIKRFVLFESIFPLYNGFIVISESLMDLVSKYKSSCSSIIKVPILSKQLNRVLAKEPPISEPYIIHAGTISEEKDGMSGILTAFYYAKDRVSSPIKIVITGNVRQSPEYNRIQRQISDLGIQDYVVFTGYLELKELETYFCNATLAIVNKLDTMQNKYCFPTKIADYTSFSIPIITTDVGEASNYLRDGENSYIVKSGDPELLASKIIDVFSDTKKSRAIGDAGRATCVAVFDRNIQGERLYKYLQEIVCAS